MLISGYSFAMFQGERGRCSQSQYQYQYCRWTSSQRVVNPPAAVRFSRFQNTVSGKSYLANGGEQIKLGFICLSSRYRQNHQNMGNTSTARFEPSVYSCCRVSIFSADEATCRRAPQAEPSPSAITEVHGCF